MRPFCLKCLKAEMSCVCRSIRQIATTPHFVILMHPKERRKRSGTGTGRLTHLCISNSVLIEGMHFDSDAGVRRLLEDPCYFACVLFPDVNGIDLTAGCSQLLEVNGEAKIPLVFVLDGSWSCAQKILKVNPVLASLPRVHFVPQKKSQYEFKRQPHPDCLSTIEAVHDLVSLLNEEPRFRTREPHQNLLDVFREMVTFQKSCTGLRALRECAQTNTDITAEAL